MKYIVRLSVLSALALGTSLPAFCAPSDADMGFASQREPTAGDVGYQAVQTRGYRNEANAGGEFAGADDGDKGGTHNTKASGDKTYFDARDPKNRYLINLPYRADPGAQSQTKQHDFVGMVKKIQDPAGFGLNAPNSTGMAQFKGPQTLGFKGAAYGWTPYAIKHQFFTRATGTGSVNASITSRNGKD